MKNFPMENHAGFSEETKLKYLWQWCFHSSPPVLLLHSLFLLPTANYALTARAWESIYHMLVQKGTHIYVYFISPVIGQHTTQGKQFSRFRSRERAIFIYRERVSPPGFFIAYTPRTLAYLRLILPSFSEPSSLSSTSPSSPSRRRTAVHVDAWLWGRRCEPLELTVSASEESSAPLTSPAPPSADFSAAGLELVDDSRDSAGDVACCCCWLLACCKRWVW